MRHDAKNTAYVYVQNMTSSAILPELYYSLPERNTRLTDCSYIERMLFTDIY